jgi:hypothetical protein
MIATIAAFDYFRQIADRFFEARMQRAAVRIRARSQRFPHA